MSVVTVTALFATHAPSSSWIKRIEPTRAAALVRRARRPRRSSAVQMSAAMMNKASSKCADSRKWLTSVRSARPDWTMYQPSAPWNPTSASSANSRHP